jgi:hypothetical protein
MTTFWFLVVVAAAVGVALWTAGRTTSGSGRHGGVHDRGGSEGDGGGSGDGGGGGGDGGGGSN